MFFIAYTFNGQVHVFAGQVKIVSHLSCRTSAILKYFCPLTIFHSFQVLLVAMERALEPEKFMYIFIRYQTYTSSDHG